MKKRAFLKNMMMVTGATLYPFLNFSFRTGDKSIIRTAHIGVGNMGFEDLKAISAHKKVKVTALCDVDMDYLQAAHALFPTAKIFKDYREMLDCLSDEIDAVVVSTPDHTHAPASLMAMRKNLAVYCQKPLTHYVSECHEMRRLAKEKNLVTQMGIQVHSFYDYKLATHLIRHGILGQVSKVIAWSNKNWGYQGPEPKKTDVIPAHLDWNLWLGTSKERNYLNGFYHPINWRKVRDYGCATLGDMGVHIFDTPYHALDLEAPATVTNDCKPSQGFGFPERNIVRYTFEGTPYTTKEFEWIWFDGEEGPVLSEELILPNADKLPDQGAVFIGENGKRLLLPHFMQIPKLIVEGEYKSINTSEFDMQYSINTPVRNYESESIKHYHEFVDSCLGKSKCSASFEYASKLTETILLGVIAGRFPGRTLHYDKINASFLEQEANQYLHGDYRLF
ncbi:MAG: Gfo/Idh/MocA family oxidoreductase [Flavobacteriaceae bacterium]